jgi:hypothetical protein
MINSLIDVTRVIYSKSAVLLVKLDNSMINPNHNEQIKCKIASEWINEYPDNFTCKEPKDVDENIITPSLYCILPIPQSLTKISSITNSNINPHLRGAILYCIFVKLLKNDRKSCWRKWDSISLINNMLLMARWLLVGQRNAWLARWLELARCPTLKGHSHKKGVEIIFLNHRSSTN